MFENSSNRVAQLASSPTGPTANINAPSPDSSEQTQAARPSGMSAHEALTSVRLRQVLVKAVPLINEIRNFSSPFGGCKDGEPIRFAEIAGCEVFFYEEEALIGERGAVCMRIVSDSPRAPLDAAVDQFNEKESMNSDLAQEWVRYQQSDPSSHFFGLVLVQLKRVFKERVKFLLPATPMSRRRMREEAKEAAYFWFVEGLEAHPKTTPAADICAWVRSIEDRVCRCKGLRTWAEWAEAQADAL
jgi:hypothetical protein